MSDSGVHDECARLERELRALVKGQATEILRLGAELDAAEELIMKAKLGMNGGYAELEADEELRRAVEHCEQARRLLKRHTRRKAFTTGLGLSGFDE